MNPPEMPESQDDGESIMDQCAMEMMHAIESKDKDMFRDAFHALVSDVLDQLSDHMEPEEKES